MSSHLPTTLADVLALYTQSKEVSLSAKAVRNLRTTLKKSVLPSFKFNEKALSNLDDCFTKISTRNFAISARLYFEAYYQRELAGGKNEDTLRNYRSCLNRLLKWMHSQNWFQTVVQVTDIPERAPRLKSVASLQAAHRGRRKSSEYPFGFREKELTSKLQEQLNSLHQYLTAKYMPSRRGEPAIRERSWRTRKEHILCFLGWLHHDDSMSFKHLSCPLDGSKKQLDELDITLMADRAILEEYFSWHFSVKGNGYKYASQAGATALAIAKWDYIVNQKASRYSSFEDSQAVRDIRAALNEIQAEAKKERRTVSREAFDEKLLELEQCYEIVEYLRQCCAERTAQGHKRSNIRIIDSWQDYLICAILTYTPVRQREIRELEIGKNLIRESDGWWVKLTPEGHKTGSRTGKPREYPLFPCHLKERFTKDVDEYIRKWRSLENLNHNYLFFIRGTHARRGEGRGLPIQSENHLSRLIPKLIYKYTAILYGPENAKATTPHDFRRIFETWIFKHGTSEDIEVYTEVLGHSPEEARRTYQQVTSREKTEKAEAVFLRVTEQANQSKLQKADPKRNITIGSYVDVSKLLTILTPEQRKQLGLL